MRTITALGLFEHSKGNGLGTARDFSPFNCGPAFRFRIAFVDLLVFLRGFIESIRQEHSSDYLKNNKHAHGFGNHKL